MIESLIKQISTPSRLTFLTFFTLILVGTFLLLLPLSVVPGKDLHFLDALFLSTSASCVTGLVTIDPGSHMSTFGQVVLLFLIQLGGLGIMTLSVALPALLGKSLGLGQKNLFHNLLDSRDASNLPRLIKSIVIYTFIIELLGALILTLRWNLYFHDLKKAAYYGLFHSISAFCNAGFSLFSNSLELYRNDPYIMATVMVLIVLGGLGFSILQIVLSLDLIFNFNRLRHRLSASMKLTLTVTAILIFLPTPFFFFTEFVNGPGGTSVWTHYNLAIFQSITARTAGFSTIDLNQWSYASIFLFCILMFIGASPGGTGGGVKTNTIGILVLSIRTILFRQKEIRCFGRKVPEEDITKSIAITMMSFLGITVAMIILFLSEKAPFHHIFFEVISAFATVGASLGLTPQLSDFGKLAICALMLLGRIGPLTLALSLNQQKRESAIRLPEDHFSIG